VYFAPRRADRTAAVRLSTMPIMKDILSDGIKACASVCGNQVMPVNVLRVSGLIIFMVEAGRLFSRICTGLYPRNAANSALVGGMLFMIGMSCCAPALESERAIAGGNSLVRLTMIIVKNMAMLDVMAVFWSVDRMPEATPRSSGGTLFMIDAMFGELNMPLPMPMSSSARANCG